VLPLITTANIACGFHAGDPATAYSTISLAAKHGVRSALIRVFLTARIWPARDAASNNLRGLHLAPAKSSRSGKLDERRRGRHALRRARSCCTPLQDRGMEAASDVGRGDERQHVGVGAAPSPRSQLRSMSMRLFYFGDIEERNPPLRNTINHSGLDERSELVAKTGSAVR